MVINVLKSVSWVMNYIVSEWYREVVEKLCLLMVIYVNFEDLINIGVYKRGFFVYIDEVIYYYFVIDVFLK